MTTPRRRWFAFSVKTLFVVVTVVAILASWTLKVRRDRNSTRDWIKSRGLIEISRDQIEPLWEAGAGTVQWDRNPMPLLMRLIGDTPLIGVGIPGEVELTATERARIERDFPEAGFVYGIGGF